MNNRRINGIFILFSVLALSTSSQSFSMFFLLNGGTEVVKNNFKALKSNFDKLKNYFKMDIFQAIENNNIDRIVELVNAKDPSINDVRNGGTPLYWACSKNHIMIVIELLKHPDIDVNKNNGCDSSPFYYACEHERTAILEELLRHPSINVDIMDNTGHRALDRACRFGFSDVAILLLGAGGATIDQESINNVVRTSEILNYFRLAQELDKKRDSYERLEFIDKNFNKKDFNREDVTFLCKRLYSRYGEGRCINIFANKKGLEKYSDCTVHTQDN